MSGLVDTSKGRLQTRRSQGSCSEMGVRTRTGEGEGPELPPQVRDKFGG